MPRQDEAPRPTTVLFVRHGTTPTTGKVLPGRASGLHLSDQGRAEAEGAAGRLAGLAPGTVAAVYASTLERAQETAAPIAAAVGLAIVDEPRLVDCDTGEWTGRELKALYKLPQWRDLARWPGGFRFPGGESIVELRERVGAAVASLRAAHPGGVVVAVSHADPIKIAIAEALGSPLEMLDRILVSPASVSAVAYGAGGPAVLAVNTTGGPLPVGQPPAGTRDGRRAARHGSGPGGDAAR